MALSTISAHWHVAVALTIGGVTAGLPLVLLKAIRLSAAKLILGAIFFLAIAVAASMIVALGGSCSFTTTLLMADTGCSYFPFVNSRNVPVLLILSLTSVILSLIALLRDFVLWLNRA